VRGLCERVAVRYLQLGDMYNVELVPRLVDVFEDPVQGPLTVFSQVSGQHYLPRHAGSICRVVKRFKETILSTKSHFSEALPTGHVNFSERDSIVRAVCNVLEQSSMLLMDHASCLSAGSATV